MALTGMLDAPTVVRHLRRQGTWTVSLGPFTNVWTPERPRPNSLAMGFYQMPGRGTLSYSLEPDQETVRMQWQPKHGSPRVWVGPVPVVATADFQSDSHRGIVVSGVTFAVIVGLGAVAGAVGGSFLGGLAAGIVAGYFVAATVWAARKQNAFLSAQQRLRGSQQSDRSADEASLGTTSAPPVHSEQQDDSALRLRHQRVLRIVYVMYAVAIVLGFLVGYFVTGGSPGNRFVAGTIGIVVAVAVAIVTTDVMRGGGAIKRVLRRS
jgi:hypothetical protein